MTGTLNGSKQPTLDVRELFAAGIAHLTETFNTAEPVLDRVLGIDMNGNVMTERHFRQKVMAEVLHVHVMKDLLPRDPAGLDRVIRAKGI